MKNKMINDLVTVVIPTYNDSQYLKKAIDDILKQTYEKFELLIVNDGSTDNTEEILSEYEKKDKRIKVFNKKNGGTGSALNYGFSKANGEFGTWVSSDDSKEETYLEDLVNFLIKNRDIEFVCSSFFSKYLNKTVRAYGEVNNNIQRYTILEQDKHDGTNTNKWYIVDDWAELNNYSCMLGVCFMFTMRLKNKMGDYLCIPGEDYYMTMKMALNTRSAYLDKCLGTHNNPPDSLSMVNRECVAKANILTRRLYAENDHWNLKKIPKIASFYWGSDKMSFLRYLTILSFKINNPDWSIHLYIPKNVSNSVSWKEKGGDNFHKCDQKDYKGEDYYDRLVNEVAVKIIKVDFSKTFLTKEAPEPHKSDLLTWQILATKGGLWCDMDIVFCRPLNDMFKYYNPDSDTVLCYDNRIPEYDGSPSKPIGFLLSSPNNIFFKRAILESKNNYKSSSYQSIGTVTLKRLGNTIEECKRKFYTNVIENINPDHIYHFHHKKISQIYNKNIKIPEQLIGIHWYGGHPLSQEFNNRINLENYKNENNTLGNLIKEVLR